MATVRKYRRVFGTFFRNSCLRELTFRSNFLITLFTRGFWFIVQVIMFDLIYRNVNQINDWSREEYFGFMATGMLVNALVEAFFMPNCARFSELIRTGDLDFALLKPIDTQFLVSLEKMELAMVSQVAFAVGLLIYSVVGAQHSVTWVPVVMYLLLIVAAVVFFYSLMIGLAATSIFFGRNQGLLDFWFYVTIFARYPSSIYTGSPTAEVFRFLFSYVLPILLVITVPARVLLGKALEPNWLSLLTLASAAASFAVSRLIFNWSLQHYRSASS
ncbi:MULTISPECIES: ABC transporter permease [unclassified Schlesneria]|uniref:ABC transporter permease n=1 Tax=Schlesneria TaxID=656899 RepID=UPI002EED70EB